MPRPTRAIQQEIDDIENWLADLNNDLDMLEDLVLRCETERCRRKLRGMIETKTRRLIELQQRRIRLYEQLGE